MKTKLFLIAVVSVVFAGFNQLSAQSFQIAPSDSIILSAELGLRDSTLLTIKKMTPRTAYDSLKIDSIYYQGSSPWTVFMGVSDSSGVPFNPYRIFNYPLLFDSAQTARFYVTYYPLTRVWLNQNLIIKLSRFLSNGTHSTMYDTILVRGKYLLSNHYISSPDSFNLQAQVGIYDSSFGNISSTVSTMYDSIFIDSLRFKSTRRDTGAFFIVLDSLQRPFPVNINRIINPFIMSGLYRLRYTVKFRSTFLGTFGDSLFIYYRYPGANFNRGIDTIRVQGISTSPPPPGYDSLRISISDTLLMGQKRFPGDTVTLPVLVNSIRYNNHNGIYSFQMVLVYNDSLFQCLGYDSSGTVLSNRGGLTEFTLQFRKDSGRGPALDTLRIAGASDDSLYYPEVPGTPFAFPRPLIKLKFRIPTTAHNSDSTILRFTRFMFNEGIPASSTDDGSIKLKLRKKGDVDKNGIIQPYDAVLVLRYVIHDTTLDAESQIAAEVSNNGEITAYDASLILQYFVGRITTFPAGSYYKQSLPSNRGAELALEWSSMQDGLVTVSVNAKNLAEVYGYSFELAYDPSVLTYLGNRSSDITKAMTSVVKAENGVLRFASAGVEAVNGDGALVQLTFRVSGNVNQDKIIQIVQAMLNEEIIITQSSTVSKPNTYALEQNYPNPFNPDTRIRYQIPEVAQVQLVIYNLLGQRVRTLINSTLSAGMYEVVWDGKNDQGINLASGVYIYRIKASNFVSTRKLILMK